jgi:hypothetical protein
MKLIVQSKVSYVAVSLLAAFIPIAVALTPRQLYLMTGSMLLTTSMAAVLAYLPVIRYTIQIRVAHIDRTDLLTFGIVLLFAGTAFREAYVTFWWGFFPPTPPRPDGYLYPLAFVRYTCVVASMMALSAREMVIGPSYLNSVPGWPYAIVSTALGILLGVFMIFLLVG